MSAAKASSRSLQARGFISSGCIRRRKSRRERGKTEADVENEDKPKKSFDLGFALDDWLKLIKVALRALGRFKNGVYFGYIYLHAVVSAPDPYDAVMRYNAVNGFVGSIIPFFENEFKVKRKDIYIGLDMNGEKAKPNLRSRHP